MPFSGFRIISSIQTNRIATQVVPDLATCADCRREIANPRARRYQYPFTNCTQCGPRYSIITGLPYDRPQTTMHHFRMCSDCQSEYSNPLDRRFHAQPIACPRCGPELVLASSSNTTSRIIARGTKSLVLAAKAIIAGRILAVKGIGGFHLMCDAGANAPIKRIREIKSRDTKPLAIMCHNISAVRRLCRLSVAEETLLRSRTAPIVLLQKRTGSRSAVSDLVAPANNYLGVMLPYAPIHHLLFKELKRLSWQGIALVATSANRQDEPIATTETELEHIRCHTLVLTHNRHIANRCDDSVVALPSPRLGTVIIRRARGFVPEPIRLAPMFHVKHPVLAVGADHRGALALVADRQAWFSPHIGTPTPGPGEEFFLAALRRLEEWTGIKPELVACDLHPDYWSTRLAERLAAERNLPLLRVQHHLAHALSAAAEDSSGIRHARTLALVCDGTGLGIDGHIWGCELLLIEPNLSWIRVGHMREIMLSGGITELFDPSLLAAEWLDQLGMSQERISLGICNPISGSRRVPTSSLGRLFDVVAAITGICRRVTFSGEAAIALEAAASQSRIVLPDLGVETNRWPPLPPYPRVSPADTYTIDPEPLVRWVVSATTAGMPALDIALCFHEYLARLLRIAIKSLAQRYRVHQLILSGGSFQNRLLLLRLSHIRGMRTVLNHATPLGDGGLALGQAVAAGVFTNSPFSSS